MQPLDGDQTGRRGRRSQATRDELVQAALGALEEGRGLARLGLSREEVCERADKSAGTFDYHFGPKGSDTLPDAIARWLRDTMIKTADDNSGEYDLAADAVAGGAGRAIIGAVLLRDVADFTQIERLFYLLVALADLDPDVARADYAARLREAHERSQAFYEPLYDRFCQLTDREFIAGRARTQRAVNAYLEGIAVHARYGMAHPKEEVIDTVLRIFWATTKQHGTAGPDIDDDLFGAAERSN